MFADHCVAPDGRRFSVLYHQYTSKIPPATTFYRARAEVLCFPPIAHRSPSEIRRRIDRIRLVGSDATRHAPLLFGQPAL